MHYSIQVTKVYQILRSSFTILFLEGPDRGDIVRHAILSYEDIHQGQVKHYVNPKLVKACVETVRHTQMPPITACLRSLTRM